MNDLPALPRFLQSVAKLRHRQNSAATDVGQRQRINWTDTATTTFTVTDSPVNEEVSVSVATVGSLLRTSVYASLPSASSAGVGTTYLVTDSFHLIMSDGTNWHYLDDPPAAVLWSAATSAWDSGWQIVNGATITGAQTSLPWVWAVIDSAFKSGSNIVLPDWRGRGPVGLDNMGGSDAGRLDLANTMGLAGGEQYHTLTSTEMPSHTHTQNAHTHTQDAHGHTAGDGNGFWGSPSALVAAGGGDYGFTPNQGIGTTAATNQNTTATNQNTGGGGSHNTMQPYQLMNAFIRL